MEISHARAAHAIEPPATVDGIAVLRWPEHDDRALELERMGAPRVLLVASGAEPPALGDPLCDWAPWPPDERDLQQRIVALRRAASRTKPILGEHGVIWRGDAWTALSPIEARLMAEFLGRPGRVISRARLERSGWPDGLPNGRAVDARMKVLRRRVASLGVRIHTVRGQGFLAEIQPLAV